MVKALVFGTKDLCVRIAPWWHLPLFFSINFFFFWGGGLYAFTLFYLLGKSVGNDDGLID